MSSSAHARLSASSSARWLACPGSVQMCEAFPDVASEYAEEGTAAHEFAEYCLKNNKHAVECIGQEFNGYIVDEETARYIQMYLDYVRNLKGDLYVEQRVDYSSWAEKNSFGTADAINMKDDVVTIVDLKFGKGLKIFAENNSQAMLYALGVLNDYSFLYECQQFHLVVVQPRIDHIDEWTVSLEDLLAFGEYSKAQAEKTRADKPELSPGEKQCRFCRAQGACKALAEYNLQTAIEDFKSIEVPGSLKDPHYLTNDEVALLLPRLKLFSNWIKSIEAYAAEQLERGYQVVGYKLVEGRTIRKWGDDAAAEKALRKKLKVSQIFTKKTH